MGVTLQVFDENPFREPTVSFHFPAEKLEIPLLVLRRFMGSWSTRWERCRPS